MVVFPKQICKRFLPETGESRSAKTFFLQTNMDLDAFLSGVSENAQFGIPDVNSWWSWFL